MLLINLFFGYFIYYLVGYIFLVGHVQARPQEQVPTTHIAPLFNEFLAELPTLLPEGDLEKEIKLTEDELLARVPWTIHLCQLPSNTDDALIQRVLVEGRKLVRVFKARSPIKKRLILKQIRAACNYDQDIDERVRKIKYIFYDFYQSPAATGTLVSYNIETFLSVCGSVYSYAKCHNLNEKKLAHRLYRVVFDKRWPYGRRKEFKKSLIRAALEEAKIELRVNATLDY